MAIKEMSDHVKIGCNYGEQLILIVIKQLTK